MQHHCAPAQCRGSDPDRAERVSRVMLAIAECALAVFPCLPPVNGGQPEQKGLWRKLMHQPREPHGGAVRAPFECVHRWRIVVKARRVGKPRERADQQVALGGMKVSARRVAAQRPARAARLLPGRERERVFEQPRKRARRDRRARHGGRTKQVLIRWRERLPVGAESRQAYQRRALVAAKRIGLVHPIQRTGPERVAVEVVLGSLVIPQHLFEFAVIAHHGARDC
jgi:hypothetical protein